MSSQVSSACCAQVLINFPPTTGAQALCLSSPHLGQGKFGVHVQPTNRLLVQTKSTCSNPRAESAGAWKGGRLPGSMAVVHGGDGHIMMPGRLSIVPKSGLSPTAALRPRPMSNGFLGRRDQRHGQRLLESACTVSNETLPLSTPQDVEDKFPDCSDLHDTSSDNIISESEATGLATGVITLVASLAGHQISTLDSTCGGSIPGDLQGFVPSALQEQSSVSPSAEGPQEGTKPPPPPRIVSVALDIRGSFSAGPVGDSPPQDPKGFNFTYEGGQVDYFDGPSPDPRRFRFTELSALVEFDSVGSTTTKKLRFTLENGSSRFNGPEGGTPPPRPPPRGSLIFITSYDGPDDGTPPSPRPRP